MKVTNLYIISILSLAGTLLQLDQVYGQKSIVNSKHNLSVFGEGKAKAVTESRICIFCHTTHHSSKMAQLWNRDLSNISYIPYSSSTMAAKPGQPTGTSKLCLSCHDGTIALGKTFSKPGNEIRLQGGVRSIPPHWDAYLGTDLSNDHPISFQYGEIANTELLPENTLEANGVKLDHTGEMQCTSCHNVHDDSFGKFLRKSNIESRLCVSCHNKPGWNTSKHRNSNATWKGTPGKDSNPWPRGKYKTVRENGCGNCHFTHSAPGKERLLTKDDEAQICFPCHNGKVASHDVEYRMKKAFGHTVAGGHGRPGIHDPSENYAVEQIKEHVTCVDCHNAHQDSDTFKSTPPAITGNTRGVAGIQANGEYIQNSNYVYEICFKCHGNEPNNVAPTSGMHVVRESDGWDTVQEFNINNDSFHPVVAPSPSRSPSLIGSGTLPKSGEMIYCHDCHNDGDNSVTPQRSGAHGSDLEWMLGKKYVVNDPNIYTSSDYTLCYKCHSETSILNDESFSGHRLHVVENNTPCAVCHDAHGVQRKLEGDSTHLINFDTNVVGLSNGARYFRDCGERSGSCVLLCHGENHAESNGMPEKKYGSFCP